MAGHSYLSTACHHHLHPRCRVTCKYCPARCRCACHDDPGPAIPQDPLFKEHDDASDR